jgi:hypothetical protein
MPELACPNCSTALAAQAASCPRCGALFGPASSWKPAPRDASRPAGPLVQVGDGLMMSVKLLLSALLFILSLVVFFGGEWSWQRPLAALFFLAMSLLV